MTSLKDATLILVCLRREADQASPTREDHKNKCRHYDGKEEVDFPLFIHAKELEH